MVIFISSYSVDSTSDNPFKDTTREGNFNKWIKDLEIDEWAMVKISKPIYSKEVNEHDYDLLRVSSICLNPHTSHVVSLDDNAAEILEKMGLRFFKLPDPNVNNPFLSKTVQLNEVLKQCKQYLKK